MEVLPHDQYNVRVEGSRQLTLRNRRYLRKYTRSQPQQFEFVPVEREIGKQANAHVPGQVTRGREVGEARLEDPVQDQVVQGPVDGDVQEDGGLQPQEVVADPSPITRKFARMPKGPTKYKDFVIGSSVEAQV